MRVLVAAATRHDATFEIAEAIASGLTIRGLDAEAHRIDAPIKLGGFDAAVIGSAVYMGRWLPPARRFIETNGSALVRNAGVAVQLRSVGAAGPSDSARRSDRRSRDGQADPGARSSRVRRAPGEGRTRRIRADHVPDGSCSGSRLSRLGRDRRLRVRDCHRLARSAWRQRGRLRPRQLRLVRRFTVHKTTPLPSACLRACFALLICKQALPSEAGRPT